MSRLRVFVITKDGPLYVKRFHEDFLHDLPWHRPN